MNPRAEEIAQYAEAVRAALDDIPEADRQELVEDLEDHLAEVAAELQGSGEPLTARLGAPEAYAAELRTAYGADGGRGSRSLRTATLANMDQLERQLKQKFEDLRVSQRVWEFLVELRPSWWLLRGYLAAMLVWYLMDRYWHLLPQGFGQAVLSVVLAVVSVVLGMRARERRSGRQLRMMLIAANALAVLGMLFVWSEVGTSVASLEASSAFSNDSSGSAPMPENGLDGVANIYPYSKDGKPLKDVLLYDQSGRPIQVNYEEQGFTLNPPCGVAPPIANSYPLPLTQSSPYTDAPEPGTSPSCAPPSATPAPHPTESPSESPSKSPASSPSTSKSR